MKTTGRHFDVCIVGGGPAAIFAAYEFTLRAPRLQVALLEAGHPIKARFCPLAAKKTDHCLSCKPCSIMRGFGGAGAFSDGKYNFTTEFGGWLTDYLPVKTIEELIDYVDGLNCRHGAPGEYFTTKNSPLAARCLQYDLHLLSAKVRHLGTENNLLIMESIYAYLKDKIALLCDTAVKTFSPAADGFNVTLQNGEVLTCPYLICAPGRAGAEWFAEECRQLDLPLINNQVDVGVRVEVPAQILKEITD